MFKLQSYITVGTKKFTGVHEVQVKRGVRGFADTCTIKLPHLAVIKNGNAVSEKVTTGTLFNDGEKVSVALGYNGALYNEFEGFVRRRTLSMPMVLECEGYSYQLRNNVGGLVGYLPTTTVEQLAKIACGQLDAKGKKIAKPLTDIQLTVMPDANLHFQNIRLNEATGVDVLNKLRELSQGTLAIYFQSPKNLWIGVTHLNYQKGTDPLKLGDVSYRLGYNCIKDNGLKMRTVKEKVQVIYGGTLATGHRVETASEYKYNQRKLKATFNNIPNTGDLKTLANEKALQMNYEGYEGVLTGFLQPYCQPGWVANIYDSQYPERNGKYLIESTTVIFGQPGARRLVELGPQIGFTIK